MSSDYGSLLSVVQLDVTDPASIDASFEAVGELTDALDLLVNNAGVKLPDDDYHIGALKRDEMLRIFSVNSIGSIDKAASEMLGWGLSRTMTLAEGGERCDFRFKKGGKTNVPMPQPAKDMDKHSTA